MRIIFQVKPRRLLFQPAEQQMLDGIEREGLPVVGVGGRLLYQFHGKDFQQAQDLYILASPESPMRNLLVCRAASASTA